jgi:hypothetical protein
MTFLDKFFDLAKNPAQVFADMISKKEVRTAIWGYVIGALSLMMMCGIEGGGTISVFWLFMGFVGFLIFNLGLGFFFAASAHLFLELTTGKGNAVGLFILLGLSEFTKALLVAFALMASAIPQLAAIRWLIVIAILILQLMFILFMMQRVYGLGKIRSFFALAISVIPSAVFFFAAGFALISFIFWLILK